MLYNPSYPSNFALQLFITVIYIINSGIIINDCKIGEIYLFIDRIKSLIRRQFMFLKRKMRVNYSRHET
jgi:hypothetical protein